MKCFYVYTEDDHCFDCGEGTKNIVGYYKGELSEEKMMKIARIWNMQMIQFSL